LDGCHIPSHILEKKAAAYQNRKDVLTQKILGICTFDMRIAYVLARWEGSANDGRYQEIT
jgi:hypothetical protein